MFNLRFICIWYQKTSWKDRADRSGHTYLWLCDSAVFVTAAARYKYVLLFTLLSFSLSFLFLLMSFVLLLLSFLNCFPVPILLGGGKNSFSCFYSPHWLFIVVPWNTSPGANRMLFYIPIRKYANQINNNNVPSVHFF